MTYLNETRRTQAHRTAAWARLFVLLMVAALLLVLMRVAQLKVAPGAHLEAAMVPRLSSRPELARRGDLLDVRGRVLATSTVGYRLFVDPTQVDDLQTVAHTDGWWGHVEHQQPVPVIDKIGQHRFADSVSVDDDLFGMEEIRVLRQHTERGDTPPGTLGLGRAEEAQEQQHHAHVEYSCETDHQFAC